MKAERVQDCIDRIKMLQGINPSDACLMEELMSKEIPQEPVPVRVYPDGQYTCQRCGRGVTNILRRDAGAFEYTSYIIPDRRCRSCGQIQDWSHTEWTGKVKEDNQ